MQPPGRNASVNERGLVTPAITAQAKHFRLEGEPTFVKHMTAIIRRANSSDIPALIEFNQAMALETEGKQLDTETLINGVKAVFNDSAKGFYVVAESDGQILGGLMVTTEWSDWRNGWFWWIQSVYITPEGRGQGIYRKLYEFVKKNAGDDVCGFRLYVEKENELAQAVYEKLGMEKTYYLMYEEPANL